jgi:molybdopterin-synthase adenylyltransferase
MPLSDEQIERYSRQLILPEIGPGGQERLAAARVAVVGDGVAAERVVAYLAAAGVGHIATAPALQTFVDGQQPDVTLARLDDAADQAFDAVVVVASDADRAVTMLAARRGRAAAAFWIADGAAGGVPPCPVCAAAALSAPAPHELVAVRDMLVGTVVATELVKSLLGIGTPLRGRRLSYDPKTATVIVHDVTARPTCNCAGTP